MPTETLTIDGNSFLTLKELLRPGLRAVFVGINPTPKSVAAGHYYQGQHGKLLWKRLQKFGIVSDLHTGREDEAAYEQGIGFADLIRRPTGSSNDLSKFEFRASAVCLVQRLVALGRPYPVIVFVYATAAKECEADLKNAGFLTLRMPSPYSKLQDVERKMQAISNQLNAKGFQPKNEHELDKYSQINSGVTAIEIAEEYGLMPKKYRKALRSEKFSWHGHYEKWTVYRNSPEHEDMLKVARRLANS